MKPLRIPLLAIGLAALLLATILAAPGAQAGVGQALLTGGALQCVPDGEGSMLEAEGSFQGQALLPDGSVIASTLASIFNLQAWMQEALCGGGQATADDPAQPLGYLQMQWDPAGQGVDFLFLVTSISVTLTATGLFVELDGYEPVFGATFFTALILVSALGQVLSGFAHWYFLI